MEALGIVIAIVLFGVFLYASLKVASDADDIMEEMMEKKGGKK